MNSTRPSTRSQEEFDLLQRSNKKVKPNVQVQGTPMELIREVEESEVIKDSAMEDNHGMAFEMNKVTFKEKLLGSHPKEKSLVMADEISDDED